MELLFPSAFLALALAHFVALLSPGPDFFLLVGYAARYRLRGSAAAPDCVSASQQVTGCISYW